MKLSKRIAEKHLRVPTSPTLCRCSTPVPTDVAHLEHVIEEALREAELDRTLGVTEIDRDIELLRSVLGLGRWEIMAKIDELLGQRTFAAALEEAPSA